MIHDIDVKWHHCEHCDYKTKQKGNIKIHMALKHDIDVKWHHCGHCDFKTRQKSDLKRQIKINYDFFIPFKEEFSEDVRKSFKIMSEEIDGFRTMASL
jgi:hypothetical protein